MLFVELGRGGLGPKAVALLGVLGAAMVALRLPGFVAGFSAMFIVVLVAGNAFGPGFGFLLGAVGTFASGLFIGGLGPWLPFQMVAVGWVGMGAGSPAEDGSWRVRIGALAAYGVVSGYLFGAVMNLWSWPFLTGRVGGQLGPRRRRGARTCVTTSRSTPPPRSPGTRSARWATRCWCSRSAGRCSAPSTARRDGCASTSAVI